MISARQIISGSIENAAIYVVLVHILCYCFSAEPGIVRNLLLNFEQKNEPFYKFFLMKRFIKAKLVYF